MENRKELVRRIKNGEIIIYPTDTIYGIGCNALNSKSVKKIRGIKKRDSKPFSVIVPSKEWIRKNCYVDGRVEKWLEKLPGAYTLILELRELKDSICIEVNGGKDTLGIRIPKHWISEVVEKAGVPFVTTSVNLSGENPIMEIIEIPKEFKDKVNYIVNEGRIEGRPSTVINLLGGDEKINLR
jgi:L-threonylcarbamoyladenylate synthase